MKAYFLENKKPQAYWIVFIIIVNNYLFIEGFYIILFDNLSLKLFEAFFELILLKFLFVETNEQT